MVHAECTGKSKLSLQVWIIEITYFFDKFNLLHKYNTNVLNSQQKENIKICNSNIQALKGLMSIVLYIVLDQTYFCYISFKRGQFTPHPPPPPIEIVPSQLDFAFG